MCTNEGETLCGLFTDIVEISQGYVPLLGCRLLFGLE